MNLLLLTDSRLDVLPALDLLPYTVQVSAQQNWATASKDPHLAAILVDASRELAQARATCRALHTGERNTPVVALVRDAGLAAVGIDWCIDEFMLTTAGPAEVAARLSLVVNRRGFEAAAADELIRIGDLTIDPHSYTIKLRGESLTLTYKEFELLKFLAQQPGRVFSRDQLLREVWGYDYFGGTRTVDVHVRRLRAKLGPRCETMIGTVRQVGYKFVTPGSNHSAPSIPGAGQLTSVNIWERALMAEIV